MKRATWLLITAVTLVAAEGVLRRLRRSGLLAGASPVSVVHDAELGWRLPRDVRARHRSRHFDVTVALDGAGRRVPLVREERPGRPIAVFVGDSVTFGWGVEAEQSFAEIWGTLAGFEVLNLGVPGYGTDQAYLALLADGLPLAPGVVVYTYCGNDLEETVRESAYGRAKPRLHWEAGRLVVSPASARGGWLERRSVLYRALRARLSLKPDAAELESGRRLVTRIVAEMVRASRQAGARFVLLRPTVPWLRLTPEERVAGAIEVDYQAALSAPADGGSMNFPDGHPRPGAHGEIAAALVRALAEEAAPPGEKPVVILPR